MITSLRESKNIQRLKRLLEGAEKIVAVTHTAPDGDAIGSTTAFQAVMQRIGKTVDVIIPDMMLASLRSVPGAKGITDAVKHPEFAKQLIDEADLIVCLDFNQLSRLSRLGELVGPSSAPKVMIDHHEGPEAFCDVIISHPETSSTCFLLFKVLCELELFDCIEKNAATSILTGMMTDTGNFAYNCSDPELYVVVSELMRKGADKEKIYKEQFATTSLNSLRLKAYAISDKMDVDMENHCAIISLTQDELNKFEYVKGDTEGLVNIPLEIPGIDISIFLREEKDFVKASMRTSDNCKFANKICSELFGGGGHDKAAGGEFDGTLHDCIKLIKSKLPEFKEKYIKNK